MQSPASKVLGFWLISACFQTSAWAASTEEYVKSLVTRAHELKLGEDIQWTRLLHYRPGTIWGQNSEADGRNFFNSPDGKTDPEAELDATIAAFFTEAPPASTEPVPPNGVPKDDQHPVCRFPARFIWLKKKLDLDEGRLPAHDCKRFHTFRDGVAARSATVVFSAYYLNNPSSAFGHSFIRLNKSAASGTGERFELLDYGINYAAIGDTGNALVYAFKGVSGLFPGAFTSVPYYYKVREYNDFESRDLWSYDVKLEPEQIEMLVAHIWELGGSLFNYKYFTENCSYHVLTMLEAANPKLTLVDRNPTIVIPVDTMRTLMEEPGLVTKISYRPSVRTQFYKRVDKMNEEERGELLKVNDSRQPETVSSKLPPESRARVLDAAADYIDLHHNANLIKGESEFTDWKQRLLLARSRLGITSEELNVPLPELETPHAGHPTRRIGIEGGSVLPRSAGRSEGFSVLSYRWALHDLLDPSRGFPDYAQIEFGNLKLRRTFDTKRTTFDEFALFRIISLSPLSEFNRQRSWRVTMAATRFHEKACNDCVGYLMEAGFGYTVQPFSAVPLYLFGLAEGEFTAAPEFVGPHFRFGVGPLAGIRVRMTDGLTMLAQANYRYRLGGGDNETYRGEAALRWGLGTRWSLNVRGSILPETREAALGVYHYF